MSVAGGNILSPFGRFLIESNRVVVASVVWCVAIRILICLRIEIVQDGSQRGRIGIRALATIDDFNVAHTKSLCGREWLLAAHANGQACIRGKAIHRLAVLIAVDDVV